MQESKDDEDDYIKLINEIKEEDNVLNNIGKDEINKVIVNNNVTRDLSEKDDSDLKSILSELNQKPKAITLSNIGTIPQAPSSQHVKIITPNSPDINSRILKTPGNPNNLENRMLRSTTNPPKQDQSNLLTSSDDLLLKDILFQVNNTSNKSSRSLTHTTPSSHSESTSLHKNGNKLYSSVGEEVEEEDGEIIKKVELLKKEKLIKQQQIQKELEEIERKKQLLELKKKQFEFQEKEREIDEKIKRKKEMIEKLEKEQEDRDRNELIKIIEEASRSQPSSPGENKFTKISDRARDILLASNPNDSDDDLPLGFGSVSREGSLVSELDQLNEINRAKEVKRKSKIVIGTNEIYEFEQIGGGVFGSCYGGSYKRNQVVIKKLNCNLVQNQQFITEFYLEVNKLMKKKHRNLFKIIGCLEVNKNNGFTIISEHVKGYSLYSILRNESPLKNKLTLQDKISIIRQILEGLDYLHKNNIKFIGLKSKNIIVSENNCVYMRDYGFLQIKNFIKNQGAINSPQYSAPELLDSKPFADTADIYSLGMILWEIFTEKSPFHNIAPTNLHKLIVQETLRPPEPENCPIVIWKVIIACWNTIPSKRPPISTILRICNQPIDLLLKYGFTYHAPPPATNNTRGLSTLNGGKETTSMQAERPSSSTRSFSNSNSQFVTVLPQLMNYFFSNHAENQMKAVKVLINLLKNEQNYFYLLEYKNLIPTIESLLINKTTPYDLIECLFQLLSILAEKKEYNELITENRCFLELIIASLSHSNKMIAIQASKILIALLMDKKTRKIIISYEINKILLEIISNEYENEKLILQGILIVSYLLEDKIFQDDFNESGGIKTLIFLLSSSNPGIQIHVLLSLAICLTNPSISPFILKFSVLKRLISLLSSKFYLIQLQAVCLFPFLLSSSPFPSLSPFLPLFPSHSPLFSPSLPFLPTLLSLFLSLFFVYPFFLLFLRPHSISTLLSPFPPLYLHISFPLLSSSSFFIIYPPPWGVFYSCFTLPSPLSLKIGLPLPNPPCFLSFSISPSLSCPSSFPSVSLPLTPITFLLLPPSFK